MIRHHFIPTQRQRPWLLRLYRFAEVEGVRDAKSVRFTVFEHMSVDFLTDAGGTTSAILVLADDVFNAGRVDVIHLKVDFFHGVCELLDVLAARVLEARV